MEPLTRFDHGIYAIDADYVRSYHAAIHLLVENGRVALIDTGSNDSLPRVLAALEALDLTPEQVDFVILTHVHLDHAGGAGAMMRVFANAQLVVHPRGVRHMVDPTRLMAGVAAVYGAQRAIQLYGEVLPVPVERIVEASHEKVIKLAGRELLCLDTPGHARHHICIVDRLSGNIFTGDTFGLSYRELDVDQRQFVFPTTTPVQFDPQALHASIDLLLSYKPNAVYLTHYSELRDVAYHGAELHRLIDAHVAIAMRERNAGAERHGRIRANLAHLLVDEVERFGGRLEPAQVLEMFATDLELNAQGLGVWLDTQSV